MKSIIVALFLLGVSLTVTAKTHVIPEFLADDQYSLKVYLDKTPVCELSSATKSEECFFELPANASLLSVNGHLIRSGRKHEVTETRKLFDITGFTHPLVRPEVGFSQRLDSFIKLHRDLLKTHSEKLKTYLRDEHGFDGTVEDVGTYFRPLVNRSDRAENGLIDARNEAEQRLGVTLPQEVQEVMNFDYEIGYQSVMLLAPENWDTYYAHQLAPRGYDEESLREQHDEAIYDVMVRGIILFGSNRGLNSIIWYPHNSESDHGVFITHNDSTFGEFEFWQEGEAPLPLSSVILSSIYRDVASRIVDEFANAGVFNSVKTKSWGGFTNDYLKVDSGNPGYRIQLKAFGTEPDIVVRFTELEALIR